MRADCCYVLPMQNNGTILFEKLGILFSTNLWYSSAGLVQVTQQEPMLTL